MSRPHHEQTAITAPRSGLEARERIDQIDSVTRALDARREELDLTKAELVDHPKVTRPGPATNAASCTFAATRPRLAERC